MIGSLCLISLTSISSCDITTIAGTSITINSRGAGWINSCSWVARSGGCSWVVRITCIYTKHYKCQYLHVSKQFYLLYMLLVGISITHCKSNTRVCMCVRVCFICSLYVYDMFSNYPGETKVGMAYIPKGYANQILLCGVTCNGFWLCPPIKFPCI